MEIPESELQRAAQIGAHFATLWEQPPDELAQDARVALWRAWPALTRRYGPTPDRGLIYVVVRRRLQDEMKIRDRRRTRQHHHPPRPLPFDPEVMAEVLADATDVEEDVIAHLEPTDCEAVERAQQIKDLARRDPIDRKIVRRLSQGATQAIIADELGRSRAYVSLRVKALRRRARASSRPLDELTLPPLF